ncbi:MAG: SDR family oxidoreductase [Thermoanaerobaculia bacterium]
MARVFVTGFPGFLGSELVRRVLRRRGRPGVLCLVQPKFAPLARERVAEVEADDAKTRGRIELLEGDITEPGLGLPSPVADGITEIFHLAAVYDLAVPREVGLKVNVDGTRNVLDFAATCTALKRFQYVSTCYVSGRWAGIFREDDLEKGQRFNNFYEETKYLAEVDVRRRMAAGLPATIYRPAVVTGDSVTGETQKYDGPYYVLRWLLKQPTVAVLPVPGDPERARINLVPRDFVIDAIDALSTAKSALGNCYHLADPEPPTIDEAIRLMGEATGRMIVRVPMPATVAKTAIDHLPGVYRLLGIPSSAVDYFQHPTFYDTAHADRDLGALGIRCPRLADYMPHLVSFMKDHPEIASGAMA